MAIAWLDLVRYADTIGYHSDTPRNVWPYRDYVIDAFNQNMPFDRFTVEQLAGDLLPDATTEQKVASCFNRLLLTTEEGGAQPKDYEARMLTDRVRAVGTVWLGQTFGCCQCHDHKFDPIATRDFYAMGAFFADIQEPIIGAREPGMTLPDEEQAKELARLQAALADAQRQLTAPSPELDAGQEAWEKAVLAELNAAGRWTALEAEQGVLRERGAPRDRRGRDRRRDARLGRRGRHVPPDDRDEPQGDHRPAARRPAPRQAECGRAGPVESRQLRAHRVLRGRCRGQGGAPRARVGDLRAVGLPGLRGDRRQGREGEWLGASPARRGRPAPTRRSSSRPGRRSATARR